MERLGAVHLGERAMAVLSAISERNPPAVSAAERRFLRDVIARADQADISASLQTT
jgi:hypothetical protein